METAVGVKFHFCQSMTYLSVLRSTVWIVYTAVTVISLLVSVCDGMQCPTCDKIHCSPRKASRLKCKGGITTGICNCCPACAKLEGQKCGGDYNYLGKCDKGFYCKPHKKTIIGFIRKDPVGTCQRGPQADAGFSGFCRPKCSPQYCRRNPKAVCSASDAAEVRRDCHGDCQHTSCNACTFQREPECPVCRKDDFRCLKKFGKCIKKQTCSRKRYPCKWRKLKTPEKGKFVCQVPQCPDAA
ncbi:insulin-like growth factor-binding protein 7 [Haliotis asinina]|uniref:insulin-like growth factor-binding protein 7 n=1 Tax=Haliotis asinina TaxID=109174 RepID=UPI003532631B